MLALALVQVQEIEPLLREGERHDCKSDRTSCASGLIDRSGDNMLVWAAVGWACRGHLPEVKLNCLTLPTPPSPSTGWALATTWEASLGARLCQSNTAARNRRGAATGDAISSVQLLAEAITSVIVGRCLGAQR